MFGTKRGAIFGAETQQNAVVLPPQVKGRLAAFHDTFDSLTYLGHVDGTFAPRSYRATDRRLPVVAPRDQIGITVDDKIAL
jgi:hypothetical protein